jgi:hypothetical protein
VFFQRHGKIFFVSYEQSEVLRRAVFGDRSDEEIAESVSAQPFDQMKHWTLVLATTYKAIERRLGNRGEIVSTNQTLQERFDFFGDEAKRNIMDALHAQSLVSRRFSFSPSARSMGEDIHNRMCFGEPWAYLFGDECVLTWRVSDQTFASRVLLRTDHCQLRFSASEVVRFRGTLKEMTVNLRSATLSLGRTIEVRFHSSETENAARPGHSAARPRRSVSDGVQRSTRMPPIVTRADAITELQCGDLGRVRALAKRFEEDGYPELATVLRAEVESYQPKPWHDPLDYWANLFTYSGFAIAEEQARLINSGMPPTVLF